MSTKERLVSLLTYTDQLAQLTQKANFSTKGYKALLFMEQQLRNRVGIHHNVEDGEGVAWLKIDRLQRRDPPQPEDNISEWIEVHRDPLKAPTVADSVLRTLPQNEAEALVAINRVDPRDVMKRAAAGTGMVDVRLLLKKQPEIQDQIDAYLSGPWLEWKTAEIPKAETIRIYEQFFDLYQTIEGSGADNPLEIVWGLGFAIWKAPHKTLQHPIIEALVEVRIDSQTKAISVTPRDREPQFYLSPFQELGVETVRTAGEEMRRDFEAIFRINEETGTAAAEEFSPFNQSSFAPVLRTAAGLLTGDGRYWPDVNDDNESREHPKPMETLTITDTWAIYARPRGNNIFVEDIGRLKRQIESASEEDIPGVGKAIVSDPGSKRGESGGGSNGSPSLSGAGAISPNTDSEQILFPKPSNDAQIRIVKRLQKEDGVVVQGPPGTGKTHTIANIICHYLATGRSVLVVSKGEPALAVLRDQIPEGIRDLTISLLTSEREGLKQLEGAITFMANEVQSRDISNLKRETANNAGKIAQLRRELETIDQRMRELAESQLSKVPEGLALGDSDWPADVAKILAESRDRHCWLDDDLGFDERYEPQFDENAIASLRNSRTRLGKDLVYANSESLNRNDLPSSRDIAVTHAKLLQARQIRGTQSKTSLPPILGLDQQSRESGERLLVELRRMTRVLEYTSAESWLAFLHKDWITKGVESADPNCVEASVPVLSDLGKRRAEFRKRPIVLPSVPVDQASLKQALERGKRTGRPFAAVSLGSKTTKTYVHQITIAGQPPQASDDWSLVLDYVLFREECIGFAYRWNALAEDFDVPEIPLDITEIESWIGKNYRRLSDTLDSAVSFHESIGDDLRRLFPVGVDRSDLPFQTTKLGELQDVIEAYLHGTELSESRFVIEKSAAKLQGKCGPVFDALRLILEREVGNGDSTSEVIEQRWSALLAELDRIGGLRGDLSIVNDVTSRIAASGAPKWAERLRTLPADSASDSVLPAHWKEAWRMKRLESFLRSIDARDELKTLGIARLRTQASLECTIQALVKSKTYIGLQHRMSVGGRLSALRQFLSAIRNIGQGTGKRATRYRGDAQRAMAKCMESVPCWIMPSWRVSESLPPSLGSFDLVIIDEASQSDIMALPALLRGKKVLVVGDDRQVSPAAVGLEERKLIQLKHGYLKDQPFKDLLMPGTSLYELAQAVFPSASVMLNEHFRCVEPIIRFSLQFYPEKFVPLRIPKPSERLDPPLIDVYVKNATRRGMVNDAEANAIVDEIEKVVNDPGFKERSIGVVCLLGNKQSSQIQKRLLERIGEDKFLRHRIACGDPPTFQGKERDIMFISMVAVPGEATAQTSRLFEQRYNVALSRARDRMYLYRSVSDEDLRNEADLKQKVISHFRSPMPSAVEHMKELIDLCDSEFERDVFQRLAEMDYRVTPQVAVGEYRIDLVVDGGHDRRLAIELDGDQYHGPDRWFDDYARQKTLERMNWEFWRCWGSSFALDPEGCMAELVETLNEKGIKPIGRGAMNSRFTEFREIDAASLTPTITPFDEGQSLGEIEDGEQNANQLTVIFDDEPNRVYQLTLVDNASDLVNGEVAISSTLGQQLLNAENDEELQVDWGGCLRKCVVHSVQQFEQAA